MEQIGKYLHSNKTVDVSERAFEWVLSWISQNYDRFLSTSVGERWGKAEKRNAKDAEESIVWVDKRVLEKQMRANGFEYNAVIRSWGEKGYIERDPSNRGWTRQIRVTGPRIYCVGININIATGLGVETVEKPPEEFIQTEINF